MTPQKLLEALDGEDIVYGRISIARKMMIDWKKEWNNNSDSLLGIFNDIAFSNLPPNECR